MIEPIPRPARKAPTTRDAETVSEPAKTPNIRCQIIWQSNAANPDEKNANISRGMTAAREVSEVSEPVEYLECFKFTDRPL